MRIFDKRKPSLIFSELKQGDVFIDTDNNILMKTDSSFAYNAVNLDDGGVFDLPAEESVILLKNVKLIIED